MAKKETPYYFEQDDNTEEWVLYTRTGNPLLRLAPCNTPEGNLKFPRLANRIMRDFFRRPLGML